MTNKYDIVATDGYGKLMYFRYDLVEAINLAKQMAKEKGLTFKVLESNWLSIYGGPPQVLVFEAKP